MVLQGDAADQAAKPERVEPKKSYGLQGDAADQAAKPRLLINQWRRSRDQVNFVQGW